MARTAWIPNLLSRAGIACAAACAAIIPAAAVAQPTPSAVVELRIVADTQPGSPFAAGAAGALPPGALGASTITTAVGLTLQARVTTTGTFQNWGISRCGFSAGTISWITHDDALSNATSPSWPLTLAALQRGETAQPGAPSPRRGLFNVFRGTVGADGNAATGNGTFTAPFINGLQQSGTVAQPGNVWVAGTGGFAALVGIDASAQLQTAGGGVAFLNSTPADATSTTLVVGPWQNVYRFIFVPRSDGFSLPSREVTVRAGARLQWANERTDISGTGAGPFALSAAPATWQDASIKSAAITFVVNTSAVPTITRQPVAVSASLLSPATFSIEFQPSSATVQWRRGGVPIDGATSATLTINPATLSDVGLYDAVVTTPIGTVTSSAVALTLDSCAVWWSAGPAGPPATGGPSARSAHALVDDIARQRTLLLGGATGPVGLSTPSGEVWSWNGSVWSLLTTTGPAGVPSARSGAAVVYDPVRSRVLLFGGHDGTSPLGDTWELDGAVWTRRATGGPPARSGAMLAWDAPRQRAVLFGGAGATGPLADTWEWNGSAWSLVLPANAPPARSDAAMAYDAARARVVLAAGTGAAGAALADTWEFNGSTWSPVTGPRPAPAGPARATYDSTRARVLMLAADSSVWQCQSGAWLKIADASTPGAPAATSAPPAAAYDSRRQALVIHGGLSAAPTPTRLATTASLRLASPVLLAGPTAQQVCEGLPVTLTADVAAAPGQTISYRWRRDGADVPGGTAAQLTFAAGASTVGSYDCIASTACGSVTTPSAAITTRAISTISAQPASVERCAGSPASLAVTVTNSTGATYQWRRGGMPVEGLTNATFTIAAVTQADAGSYDCVITTPCGVLTSQPASIVVATPVAIATQPAGPGTVCSGTPVTLAVVATGEPLRYQWRRNGQPVGGATLASYSFTATDQTAGTYSCAVSNACGTVVSSDVAVSVAPITAITALTGPAAIEPGATVQLQATAVGGAPLTYRWQRGGTPLTDGGAFTGSATATLTITGFRTGDAGAYRLVVTGLCGSATSPEFSLAPGAGTEVLYVNAASPTPGDGRTWAAPLPTIDAALTYAAANPPPSGLTREVWVAAGVYRRAGAAPLQLPGAVTIFGGFAGTELTSAQRIAHANAVVISGDVLGNDFPGDTLAPPGPSRLDNAPLLARLSAPGPVVIDRITFSGASPTTGGGQPEASGGMLAGPGTMLTLRDCTFTANAGGPAVRSGGTLVLDGSTFSGNVSTGDGGALLIDAGAALYALRTAIVGNSADGHGGGIALGAGASLRATALRLAGNSALGSGGGLALLGDRASAQLAACAITGNRARGTGGGVSVAEKGSLHLGNCTLWANAAANASTAAGGSAVWLDSSATAEIDNTIVWQAGDLPAIDARELLGGNGQWSLRFSLIEGFSPQWAADRPLEPAPLAVAALDPRLRRPAGADGLVGTLDDDLTPTPTSPAIDAGSVQAIPLNLALAAVSEADPLPLATDLLGGARRVANPYRAPTGIGPAPFVDIGAVETLVFCPADIASSAGEPGADGTLDNGDFQLFIRAYIAPPGDALRASADIANAEGLPLPDGAVDNGDFQLFFATFFTGCS